ncbi:MULTISPECIES: hypothetical protein [unclassified Erythrobacter]|jgi:site-specific recombinase XerD|uniref:hypothetical protein n=1 Tax=unclassified Erythrobacter TaxID=2633097 RepID=UPI0007B7E02F|nr:MULTISPECIES: hypothetical protein [unclassified Erythrobacter]KZY94808.1 hypothetical protein A3745_09320 [Erythrobacter sp. HI0074]KZZ07786.1 hypothetical protein A3748_13580 [Erythrobacter sp. HI0077]|tara:strand:+ start:1301 stop:1519 length:219 start_codon:yes stop_codon:yes gene_type:complete
MDDRLEEQGWRYEFERLEGAYAPSTMRSYRPDFEDFERWCSENEMMQPFPTTVEAVCESPENEGKSMAPSTV